jgi:hypothetical protein
VVTDLVQIQREGAAKSAENREFRRYLAEHHQRVEAFQAVATEVQAHIDCTQCANCCRYSIVSVRAAEVARIAACLGIDEEAVVRQFTTRDAESPRARTLLSGKRGCVFLKDNRCSIYPARPEACRNFPHAAPGTHSLGARLESLCRWVPLCPVLYHAIEGYKHLVGYRGR